MLMTNTENQTFLRTTSELNNLYARSRYYKKWSLEGFNFDYEYDILPVSTKAVIPEYLMRVVNEIDPNDDPFMKAKYRFK